MRLARFFIVIALVGLLLCGVVVAEEGVKLDVLVNTTQLTVHDTLEINLVVTITGEEQYISVGELMLPELVGFEVLSTGSSSIKSLKDEVPVVSRTQSVRCKPLAEGSCEIPAVTLDYSDTRSGELKTLNSSPISISVVSPPKGAGDYMGLGILGFVIAIVVVGSIYVYIKVQRRRQTDSDIEAFEQSAPEFLQDLEKMKVKLAHGKLTEAQSGLLTSLLIYFRKKYSVSETSGDARVIAERLAEMGVEQPLIETYLKLHDWNDSLKYGGIPRTEKEITNVLNRLREAMEPSHES